MDFANKIEQVAGRVEGQREYLEDGDSTKQTFVVPFIEALGYDTYDPNEVTPEFTVDTGAKEEGIIDYAILQGGTPALLIECRPAGAALSPDQAAPLLRALQATSARVGILTNGVEYRFYADRQTAGEGPFFEFNLLDYNVLEVEVLKRLRKSTFDLEALIARMYGSETPTREGARGGGRPTAGQESEAGTAEGGGRRGVFATLVGGLVTIVKVVVGGIVFIIGAFVLLIVVAEIYDEDAEEGTAEAFEARRAQIIETVESDLDAGRFMTAMDTADKYLEHVQDSTLQALRDDAEWAWRHDVDAWAACQRYVQERLQHPSRAHFPPTVRSPSVSRSYRGNGRFQIRAHVDPDPSSGTNERVPFTCVVGTGAGEGWTLHTLEMAPR